MTIIIVINVDGNKMHDFLSISIVWCPTVWRNGRVINWQWQCCQSSIDLWPDGKTVHSCLLTERSPVQYRDRCLLCNRRTSLLSIYARVWFFKICIAVFCFLLLYKNSKYYFPLSIVAFMRPQIVLSQNLKQIVQNPQKFFLFSLNT